MLVLKTKESPVEGYIMVPVQVAIKLNVRQLMDLLYGIESAPQLLSVTDLNIHSSIKGDAGTGELSVGLTVAGYMKNKKV